MDKIYIKFICNKIKKISVDKKIKLLVIFMKIILNIKFY